MLPLDGAYDVSDRPDRGFIDRSEYRGVEPIERKTLVIGTDVRVSEINDAVMQLFDFLPPSKSALPVTDILKKIREYIRAIVLTGCDVSVNLLLFHIQVKVTPGHGIEIFIRRITSGKSGNQSQPDTKQAEYVLIYSGEWR